MTDIKKLASKLREAAKRAEYFQTGEQGLLNRAAEVIDALSAHTPTGDERGVEALIAQGREPSPHDFLAAVLAERQRQVAKGYDSAHDDAHGPDHLLFWAQIYARRGRAVESAALIAATRDLLRRRSEPQCEPSDALDLDALEDLAKAATPGPWAPYETMQADNFVTAGGGPLSGTVVCGPTYERANTAFIAATDPQTVLALIAALRAASAADPWIPHARRALQIHDAWGTPDDPDGKVRPTSDYTELSARMANTLRAALVLTEQGENR